MDKVSIIVPVYNGEERLRVCIDSLLNQTFKNIEIILINDGSTDDSLEIINSYYKENSGIIKVVSQKNSGVASARNNGLKRAEGTYIMFVDADDYLNEQCVEKVVLGAKEKDADITRFRMTYKYTGGAEKIEKSDFPGEMFIEKHNFKRYIYGKIISGIQMNSICRTLYKKQVIENIRFREDMVTAEDLIFNIQAFTKAKNFLYLPYPFYYYYQSGKGLTGRGISVFAKYRYNLTVSAVILKHLKEWEMLSITNILKTVFRLIFITLSKLKRRFLKRV